MRNRRNKLTHSFFIVFNIMLVSIYYIGAVIDHSNVNVNAIVESSIDTVKHMSVETSTRYDDVVSQLIINE